MKKTIKAVCLSSALLSTGAFAGHNLNLGFRADLENKDQEFNKSGNDSSSAIRFENIRLKWSGDLPVNGMTYTFRWKANKQATAEQNNVANNIEYAYITKKWDNGLSLSFGKQFIILGGREDDYDAKEVYTYSQFAGTDTNDMSLGYRPALTVNYSAMNQTFGLMLINATNGDRKFAKNISWYGNLMDGMIKPIVAYHIEPIETSNKSKKERTSLGLGAQFNFNDLMLEVDYLTGKIEQDSGTKDVEKNAIIANLKYNHGDWAPFVKYIMEEEEAATKTEITSYDLGLEYALGGGNRIHAVYSSQDFDYAAASGTNDYTATTIRIGFRANVDIY